MLTILTRTDCVDSEKAVVILDSNDLVFEVVDLHIDVEQAGSLIEVSNIMKTPQLFYNGAHIGTGLEFIVNYIGDYSV